MQVNKIARKNNKIIRKKVLQVNKKGGINSLTANLATKTAVGAEDRQDS